MGCFPENYKLHYTFFAYDIIPEEMKIFCEKKYNPLISGFVKECENNYSLTYKSYNIPDYLTGVIASFSIVFVV